MIDTDARAAVRRQLDLEAEAHSLGAVRYRQNRPMPWRMGEAPKGQDEEANLPPGQQLLKLVVEPTAALLRESVEAAREKAGRGHSAIKWLEFANPEEVAYIAGRVALNSAVARASFQSATRMLGDAIIAHLEMLLFAKENKAGYVGLMRSQHGRTKASRKRLSAIRSLLASEGVKQDITVSEKLQLGAFVLEKLVEATGFFVVELVRVNPRDKVYQIRPTEAVQEWLDRQHARSELLNPMLMPMVVRPRRWRSPFTGGYLGKVAGLRLVKANGKDYQERLRESDLPLVYEAVNHVQDTAWAVNTDVLTVMREVWDSGGSIAGLPARDDRPLPPKPHDLDTNEDALKLWKREAAQVHEANAQLAAQRIGTQQRLWMAERFSPEEAIWFPHNMDFRGRIYPIPATAMHPQSDDQGKALLRFAEGKPLGPDGAYWLAVHIANLFGVDKVSFKDRVEWTYDHANELIDSALNPLDGQRFWTTADSPWMALAASFEFVGALEEKEAFVSHLPIPMDGSNSGLQHFSAMLRDPIGGAAVNLLPGAEPHDVYATVAAKAQAIVDADEDERAAPWKGGKITRAITKRPTMTFVYSATRFGMQDMILGALRDLDADNAQRGRPPHLEGADNYLAALYLSHILFEAISEVVAAAAEAMDWLRATARVASAFGQALEWTAPDGLLVRQSYRTAYGRRLKVHWQGRPIYVTLATDTNLLDTRGQANGIAPNLVHSFDAAHLRAVARAARVAGIDSLAVIHDSFGTHAADTTGLVGLLRETFVEQYRPNLLAELHAEVVAQLPPEAADLVLPPPAMGDLDLDAVLASPYLFS